MVMLVKLGAVVILTPVFLIPGVLVALAGGICGQVYIRAQLPAKREMSNAKAPVLGQYVLCLACLIVTEPDRYFPLVLALLSLDSVSVP